MRRQHCPVVQRELSCENWKEGNLMIALLLLMMMTNVNIHLCLTTQKVSGACGCPHASKQREQHIVSSWGGVER